MSAPAIRRRKEDIKAAPTKPPPVEVVVDGIPAEIRDLVQFCCWSWERDDNGKWTKPPINPQTGYGRKVERPGNLGESGRSAGVLPGREGGTA